MTRDFMTNSPKAKARYALLISALTELTGESDAMLGRLLEIEVCNLANFTSGRNVDPVSYKQIDRLLARYGFRREDGFVMPDETERCPVIGYRHLSPGDKEIVGMMLKEVAIEPMLTIFFHLLHVLDGDNWHTTEVVLGIESADRRWVSVSLHPRHGDANELIELLEAAGVQKRSTLKLDTTLYEIWRQTAPRRSEVLALMPPTNARYENPAKGIEWHAALEALKTAGATPEDVLDWLNNSFGNLIISE